MMILLDIAYFFALLAAAPFLVVKSWRTGKYRADWKGRFGMGEAVFPDRRPEQRVLLLHCVSVGELLSVRTLIARLLAADERLRIVISTGTDTGTARARALFPPLADADRRVWTVRFPLDFSFAVEAFFERIKPDAVGLVELETWPNFLGISERRGIPVAIINGRISEKSFPRYRRIRWLMKIMLRQVRWIGAQTPGIAERFAALGARPENVEVIPTLKYDNALLGEVAGVEDLNRAIGLAAGTRLLVAGSTGPGEEAAVLEAFLGIRTAHPEARLAIVPRHPEVVPQVLAAIEQRGLKSVRRSHRPDAAPGPQLASDDVFVLDTMGELRKLYALAFGVFVGRSLVKLGGSDMIEVAAIGKPCCFGPWTGNFAEVVELLLARKAATVVRDARELEAAWRNWLAAPDSAVAMGQKGREAIARQRGATDHYVEKLLAIHRPDRVAAPRRDRQ